MLFLSDVDLHSAIRRVRILKFSTPSFYITTISKLTIWLAIGPAARNAIKDSMSHSHFTLSGQPHTNEPGMLTKSSTESPVVRELFLLKYISFLITIVGRHWPHIVNPLVLEHCFWWQHTTWAKAGLHLNCFTIIVYASHMPTRIWSLRACKRISPDVKKTMVWFHDMKLQPNGLGMLEPLCPSSVCEYLCLDNWRLLGKRFFLNFKAGPVALDNVSTAAVVRKKVTRVVKR